MRITPLLHLTAPLGREEIELQEVVHDAGGMPLVRIRIRERARFTVIDVDPVTARALGEGLLLWARAQPGQAPEAG